uniref:Uncharacterized protein n=1 Tax=Setaria italica TaxID=4555 RepID=K3Z229_SETIT
MVCWCSIWCELKKQVVMKTQLSHVKCSRPVSCRTHARYLLIYILKVYFIPLYAHPITIFLDTALLYLVCFIIIIMFLFDIC